MTKYKIIIAVISFILVGCTVEPLTDSDQTAEYNEVVTIGKSDTAVCMLSQNGYAITLINSADALADSIFWYFPVHSVQGEQLIGSENSLSHSYNDTGTLRIDRYFDGVFMSTEVTLFNCNQMVWEPNSFTPNKDGLNDTWQPYWNNVKEIRWKIRSEEGHLVFDSEGNSYSRWDGTWGGHDAPIGYYQYQIWYKTIYPGDERRKSGWIQLYRWE